MLSARTKLGLEATERPSEDEGPAKIAEWLHLQVMAGEWGELEWFLAERAKNDAEAIYSHIIQSTNSGDPMLLPEEVLALGPFIDRALRAAKHRRPIRLMRRSS